MSLKEDIARRLLGEDKHKLCPKCGKYETTPPGGDRRDGTVLCWCKDDDEKPEDMRFVGELPDMRDRVEGIAIKKDLTPVAPEVDEAAGVLVPRTKGQFPPGISGNQYGPKRLRLARAYIADRTNWGQEILDALILAMRGVRLTQHGLEPVDEGTAFKATVRLSEIYFGKQIKGQVKVQHSGEVAVTTDRAEVLRRLSDEALAEIASLEDAIDVTPVGGTTEGPGGPDPEEGEEP